MLDRKIIAGFFILIAIVAISYIILLNRKEGFTLSNQFPIYASFSNDRPGYIEQSQRKYNKFSDTMDVRRGNYIGSSNENEILAAQKILNQATITSDVAPSVNTNTLFDINPIKSRAKISAPNKVLETAKLCETQLIGRDSCSALDNPKYGNCGVCLKDGSPFSTEKKDFIGGLLLLPSDKLDQRDKVPLGQNPQYQPSVGDCPGGYFFADRAECEKNANRINCKEAGENGGFGVGKTIEGKDVIDTSCAYVSSANGNVYVYEPKLPEKRSFNVNLRGITPVGTGKCKIYVYKDEKTNQVGFVESISPGTEFIVPIKNVKEGDLLSVLVVLETPYCNGKKEVFLVDTENNQTQTSSAAVCPRLNARQATQEQLNTAFQQGSQVYESGWTSDGFNGFILKKSDPQYGVTGLNSSNNSLSNTWCYGVRPQESKNKVYNTTIRPFFKTNQTGMTINSQHGIDYQATCFRSIILQWETADGRSLRTIQFQPTIMGVDGIPVTQLITDGKNTMKKLRTFGTFGNSKEILIPKPNNLTSIQSNANWIWSNFSNSQSATFDVKVPSIFADTYYPEDMAVGSRGPLISDKSSLDLLKVLPCDQQGQLPGKYSKSCLEYMFTANGGNLTKGKLALENGGIMQLNQYGDQDAITYYLRNLFAIATRGRDLEDAPIGTSAETIRDGINMASNLMFGFSISSPCEEIIQDDNGELIIVPIKAPYPAKCLAYLWQNTLNDKERGVDDDASDIKNTYVTIGERYSGLKKREGSKILQRQYPFQTCKLTGSLSPLTPTGEVNREAVEYANNFGSIEQIQNYYNNIYQTANKDVIYNSINPDLTLAESITQAEAIKKCYGVRKSFETLKTPDFQLKLSATEAFGNPESFKNHSSKNTVEGFWSPGFGFSEGWADTLAGAWADGKNVGGGLRSAIPHNTPVVLRINDPGVSVFPDRRCPGWSQNYSLVGCGENPNFKPKQNYLYLEYNPNTKLASFSKTFNKPECVFSLIHPDDNKQFQDWCAARNNMGLEPRRYMFGLKPVNTDLYFTFKGADNQCAFEAAKWPNNQPGPTQMFNWNDVSGYSNPRYPYGPYCYGGWGMVYNVDNKAMGRGNYSLNQTMELVPVTYGEAPIDIIE